MPRTILLARRHALIVARRKPYPEQGGHSQRPCGAHSPGGVLHDLGKVGVPDATLRKTHPSMGARMLAGRQLAAHDGLRWVLSRNGLGVTVRWPRRCA